MSNVAHWTERSTEDFLYSIASDFVEDLRDRMKVLGMSQSKLAKTAQMHKSFISRVFKDPGNLTLDTIIKLARSVGMKVSIVAYEDDSRAKGQGPIDAGVFRACWEKQLKPRDYWSHQQSTMAITGQHKALYYFVPTGRHGISKAQQRGVTKRSILPNLDSAIQKFERASTEVGVIQGEFSTWNSQMQVNKGRT